MALMIGTQLGPHEITALLGKGGMGEEYRARDAKLKREVAIKVLPDEFARDPDRIGRFQREAELLASLNHPNIAAIYDLEEANGSRFIVLELVEGETLAERLERGPIPIDEALRIARDICQALETAHERAVVHRDLKPGNVKITPEGNVKVLDFGLAKALEGSPANPSNSNSPTLTLAGTNVGVILGTAAYMSPEQARGQAADARSDVFSFGCVLYEMLTGRQAFQGDNVSDVLASVLKTEPDFNLLPSKLHPKVHEVLRRCLQKNPKLRWYAIGDARVEIDAVIADPRGVVIEEQRTVAPKPALWKRVALFVMGILAVVLAVLTGWYLKPSPLLHVARFSVMLGEGQQFTGTAVNIIAISPDGTQIVYEANKQLYRRALEELEARPIPGTQTTQLVGSPVFSPDGKSIVFGSTADLALKKVALNGAAAVTICSIDNLYGMSWTEDGIVWGQVAGIMRVSANGGKPETLVAAQNGETLHGPEVLPGGQAILFTVGKGQGPDRWDNAQIAVQSLKSGERKTLIEHGSDARYVPTGQLVYASGGRLFAVPFDLQKLQVTGGAVPLVEGVRRSAGNYSGAAHYSFSRTGNLIYVPGPVSTVKEVLQLAFMDRKGALDVLKIPPQPYGFPRLSPDGKRIAFTDDNGTTAHVWIYDLGRSAAPRQLTVGGSNRYPVWLPDGERVAFQSNREGDLGIFWQRADGAGTPERLTKPEPGIAHIPDSWSPDGQILSFTALKGPEAAVWIFSLKDKKSTAFAQMSPAFIGWSAFSPDGKWLAYSSNETGVGSLRVWAQPFPATGAKYPIVQGTQPFWSRDGKEIFFNSGPGANSVVNVTTDSSLSFSPPMLLPRGITNSYPLAFPRNFDITPDGKHFLGVVPADQTSSGAPAAPQIQVVLNWFEDLKQRIAGK